MFIPYEMNDIFIKKPLLKMQRAFCFISKWSSINQHAFLGQETDDDAICPIEIDLVTDDPYGQLKVAQHSIQGQSLNAILCS